MRKIVFIAIMMFTLCATAQNASQARKVLDKTAAIIGNRGGATANFKISNPKIGATTGTISIKGNMFQARAGNAIVWFNGKTQWSLLKSTNEVNVTTPNEAQRMRMNPYSFISMYKSGYRLGLTQKGNNYVVRMTALNNQRSVQEMYLTINRKTYKPAIVKMREGNQWTTITVTNFRTANLPNSLFSFNAKDFPKAEVIDLR